VNADDIGGLQMAFGDLRTSVNPASSSSTEARPDELANAGRVELAIVIPTFNERANIPVVLEALGRCLEGITWEAIFVDDHSPDGTAALIRDISLGTPRVRVLERIGRRGLSSACIEGMLATAAPYIAVMDADMQHDESVLLKMLGRIKDERLDIVVGSRNIEGGSMGDFSENRVWLSQLGARISALVCRCEVSDPMSGFFLLDRRFFELVVERLTGTGFKILVDLLASSPRPVRLGEIPYHFRSRRLGDSKLDVNVELEYLFLVVDKYVGRVIPTRFAVFVLVGSLGLLVHLGMLSLLHYRTLIDFSSAQATATMLAMTFNFLLNNTVTFRDRQLKGWRLLRGLFYFYLACSVGAIVNVNFAQFLDRRGVPWFLAGISGMAISSVWNYGVNTVITWRRRRPK
jgi:dolichol-phosphate mannosyltransferase